MMRFMSRLGKEINEGGEGNAPRNGALQYESVVSIESKAVPGVRFVIHRISFGRRMELSRRVRELSRRAEFLEAGPEMHEKIEASILAQEIDAMYIHWGLLSIEGLTIDASLPPQRCCWKRERRISRVKLLARSRNSAV
jgi:hypothetical protein